MSSHIEWTDETWNPTVGCSRVSPGCDGCYAIRVAAREMQPAHVGLTFTPDVLRAGRPGNDHRPDWTGEVRLLPDRLDTPLHWRKPRRVFVDSMSDLFHPDVPESFIRRVFDTMGQCRQHTFQILTKRPQRMAAHLGGDIARAEALSYSPELLPNVWLGTSVENQRYADLRIPHLLATPAAVRFLSIEPLLGPVDIARYLPRVEVMGNDGEVHYRVPVNDKIVTEQLPKLRAARPGTGYHLRPERESDPMFHPGPFVDWVIVGGESGPGARPMHPDWVRSIRDQCIAAGVPFFFKQWGEWGYPDWWDPRSGSFAHSVDLDGKHRPLLSALPAPAAVVMRRVGKKAAGRELDGRTWDEMPTRATEEITS